MFLKGPNYKFRVGQKVYKPEGYKYPGVIVSRFITLNDKERYVVESTSEDTEGMLHIFRPEQLETFD